MSGNMESLLMGGDDSSSGESDDEVNVPAGTATTAASAVNVAAPAPVANPVPAQRAATIPTQAPVPGSNTPAPAPARGKSSQADQMARLKNLYKVSKSTVPSNTNTGIAGQGNQPVAKPLHRPPMQHSQRSPPQQQQQQRQSHQQMQQRQPHQQMQQRQTHQSVASHQASQHQHKRTQSYQQSSQQVQQQQQISSRSQAQPRKPQYSQPSQQQRQQYTQQSQQQRPSMQAVQRRQPIHRSQAQPRVGNSSQTQDQQASVDPFAPTPLSQIKQSQHNRRTHHQQPMQHSRQSTQPISSRLQQAPGGSSTSTPSSQQDLKRQKEKFLMFTRVLIKYLEQKDRRMHAQAKSIIKDCAERNKRQEPGYESVTISMKRRLKELVGDHYWRKANDYLVHFIEQKRRHAHAGASGSTSAAAQAQARMRQKQAQHLQQRQAQAKIKKDQAINMPKQRTPANSGTAPSLADEQKGVQGKREQPSSQAQSTTATKPAKSKAKSTAPSKASGNDSKTTTKSVKSTKKPARRKSVGDSSTNSRKGTTSKTVAISSQIVKRVVVEEPPREYKELMELIDHSVEYHWPSIGQLLGNKTDLKLTDEERQLLYGDSIIDSLNKKKTTKTTAKITPSTSAVVKPVSSSNSNQEQSPNQAAVEEQGQTDEKKTSKNGIQPGWGRTNVVSARAAWARIRLKELRERKLALRDSPPIVADGLLTLPTASSPPPQQQSTQNTPITSSATLNQGPDINTSTTPKPKVLEGSWINEEAAEQDKVLALLSEGCQTYITGVIQKAIQCARQRQNLDGIRLWHQQYSFNKGSSNSSSTTILKDIKSKTIDKSKKPPLALRLGCDVSRQVSQVHGNDALTVKRMEEALGRQTGIPMRVRELNTETLLEATSMGDLSWRPLLKQGAEKADYQAKRSFEVYGGKEAKDPPLGRVPKKAKLLVEDFVMGSGLCIESPYHKGYTASSSISF